MNQPGGVSVKSCRVSTEEEARLDFVNPGGERLFSVRTVRRSERVNLQTFWRLRHLLVKSHWI
jgi:hypothetical protein